MSVGNAIRKRRKQLNLTLQELAGRVDTDSGNLSRIERGTQGVSEAMLMRLCDALDCTAAYLYSQTESASGTSTPASPRLNLLQPQEFVRWFRSAAPYIHAFGGRTFVIAFGGEVVDDGQFVALSHDLNLLASLEVRLVLVHGARPQIESRLKKARIETKLVNGLRVTDDDAMEAVKEANGAVRVEIEALLSMGLVNSPMAGADIRVASGNFVTAKPLGVRDGVDLQHTGEVRKVDAIGIQKRLDDGELVLLSPLGYSPTGEVFNLTLEDVAVSAAIALDADKLIFLMDSTGVHNIRGELLREMTAAKARNLLRNVQQSSGMSEAQNFSEDEGYYLPAAVRACEGGVARTHLISRHVDGAIVQELFTHDGIGTMVTEESLESMRQAEIGDVGGILQLIEPLEAEGILVRRGRERLEMEISHFFVMEHDGIIIGCAALYPFPDDRKAELACMAVHRSFRRGGRGDRLLKYSEEQAKERGIESLFVLTTRTEHWFLERGFVETDIAALPPAKQQLYNYQRRSKVFVKKI
ncbi:MAG TPA: amino-acid N-acetyltransferase [Methylophilaceae bacterium]|nr:amino-acid N-acetyltransferase [Methylophilaceae bacterium]